MRTLGPMSSLHQSPGLNIQSSKRTLDSDKYKQDGGSSSSLSSNSSDSLKMDTDIRNVQGDFDTRYQTNMESVYNRNAEVHGSDTHRRFETFANKDSDVGHFASMSDENALDDDDNGPKLHIDIGDDMFKDQPIKNDFDMNIPNTLPKVQRELFMRIQAQQKENLLENKQKHDSDVDDNNIDWYSDDSNEDKLTIKVDEDVKEKDELKVSPSPTIKPSEVLEKLGDLSKINISMDVSKLLSSIQQVGSIGNLNATQSDEKPKDPRQSYFLSPSTSSNEEGKQVRADPRKARLSSLEEKNKEKISIYEQGSLNMDGTGRDVDLRSIEKDLDLRSNLNELGKLSEINVLKICIGEH